MLSIRGGRSMVLAVIAVDSAPARCFCPTRFCKQAVNMSSTSDSELEPLQVKIREAARMMRYDERTVRRLVERGELPAIGRGRLRAFRKNYKRQAHMRSASESPKTAQVWYNIGATKMPSTVCNHPTALRCRGSAAMTSILPHSGDFAARLLPLLTTHEKAAFRENEIPHSDAGAGGGARTHNLRFRRHFPSPDTRGLTRIYRTLMRFKKSSYGLSRTHADCLRLLALLPLLVRL